MKYCCYCGTQLSDESKFCHSCGKATIELDSVGKYDFESCESGTADNDFCNQESNFEYTDSGYQSESYDVEVLGTKRDLVNTLSSRLRLNAILWFIVAGIQIIIGVCGVYFTLIVGVLNIISAINDLKSSRRILENQNGIVRAYEPITGAIITLVYNAVVGGVVGVAGSIYYLVAVRGFVLKNKKCFLDMERY